MVKEKAQQLIDGKKFITIMHDHRWRITKKYITIKGEPKMALIPWSDGRRYAMAHLTANPCEGMEYAHAIEIIKEVEKWKIH